ncbi:BBE domain-containing protein, partial [Streptomyces erythrochromogenes]|uniref:BBE domain-containing protein n=1 Tax=Streptomyces erythrochromogenes TaxID=285574 RepID=UPI003686F494
SMTAYWADFDPDEVRDGNLAWLGGLYRDLSTDLGTSAYQNFPDGELPRWWTAYYGQNYDRLVHVKKEYDPKLLFRYPQAVRANPR